MFVVIGTGLRADVDLGAQTLEALGGFSAVGWWELERRQHRLEALAPAESIAQSGVAALAIVAPQLDARIAPLEDADWVRMSLDGLPPVQARRFLIVGEHDLDKVRGGRIGILVDAGEAFGTGHHATTLGCLIALDEELRRGRRPRTVLDLGAGSAVLAMAAARLGARCIATDIDPRAVEIAAINARLNRLTPRIRHIAAPGLNRAALRGRRYDLVFANILLRPLVKLCADIADATRPGGRIILSGLLSNQEPAVLRAYRQRGVVLERRWRKEGWSALTLRKVLR